MDVKNKVDENVDENISKKNVQDKDDLTPSETGLDYNFGKLTGYLEGRSDELKCSTKAIIKANIIGMLEGAVCYAVGHLIVQKLCDYFINKNRNYTKKDNSEK